MTTFAEDIEEAAKGEPIEAIVIGAFGWGSIDDAPGEAYNEHHSVPLDKRGIVMTWPEARGLLDYEYDDGFGAADCHAIVAWSTSWVLFIHEYDGSTDVRSVPRNPTEKEVFS